MSVQTLKVRTLSVRTLSVRTLSLRTLAVCVDPVCLDPGGTIGPDLDCSGLVQTAFASTGIWLPRDAYQQERFCKPLTVQANDVNALRSGDLIFFGTPERCTHVGIHLENGRYIHSSGIEHGRNGIGIDSLNPQDLHPVASHYRAELRGAGRVTRCHDGSTLP